MLSRSPRSASPRSTPSAQVTDEQPRKEAKYAALEALKYPPWHHRIYWSAEVLASFLCLSSFSILIVILHHYDGISATAWPSGDLTLNGLVAVLATMTRAALSALISSTLSQGKWLWFAGEEDGQRKRRLRDIDVFDQASRGPLGSLMLLWHVHGIHLATFAAAMTVLTLPFDIFSQQVIAMKTRSVAVQPTSLLLSGPANVPRAEVFTGSSESAVDSPLMGPGLSMVSAWYAGLLAFNATEVQPTCPTGNCTWPTVSSLAICGECTDVSSNVIYGLENDTKNSTWRNYALPDGTRLSNHESASSDESTLLQASWANESYQGLRYQSLAQDPANGRLMLAHFEVISVTVVSLRNESRATECALWFCVRAHNFSMTNGQLSQSTVGEWSHVDPRSSRDYAKLAADDEDNNDGSDNVMLNFSQPPAVFNVPAGTDFIVGANIAKTFATLASRSFPMQVYRYGTESTQTNQSAALWGYVGRMDSYIDNFAAILTQTLRTSSPTSPYTDTHYLGTTWRDEVYVHVRWPWLAFPVVMIVGGCVLTLATVWCTDRSAIGLWKSNAMVLLLTGVSDHIRDAAVGAMNAHGEFLDLRVGYEQVALSEVDGKWRLD
ncbi:hypothetical protein N7493_000153 [Penicillium malachiteum]|uniref:Uncharacterized protein n=1 Tax=Penicillium malachiteum TaxID=1324776 RepID=A0AAD6HVT0_9EURO|nr:hypothetical protein N7493_000153 [Penicillium malachiteum]